VYTLSLPLIEEIERITKLSIVKLEINILPPGTKIDTHVDKWGVLSNCCRIHIPVQTAPGVVFHVEGNTYTIPEGQIFEFNNQIPHSVENNSSVHRIHYVFDLIKEEDINSFEAMVATHITLVNSYFGNWTKSVRKEWEYV
jgi:aspartyl/asparaginyl beta-hydroxylase (cupin superfamily)